MVLFYLVFSFLYLIQNLLFIGSGSDQKGSDPTGSGTLCPDSRVTKKCGLTTCVESLFIIVATKKSPCYIFGFKEKLYSYKKMPFLKIQNYPNTERSPTPR